ncbi:SLBB domain-containing protein [Vibrio sp. SS-MA-C1-2]|uniref:SLBB domain-containing protein n=1 Tax=Vibrio sp. SS-MA-C1-2 TaxID=2908646 RepID=UPI001F42F29E|nr:SLBB domain-containing protein [Vibrio sp. SS-MA-C1-2]UJF18556.1 SLBB domain-containing protein [Vibrio sp. SS-MA-C1-2]
MHKRNRALVLSGLFVSTFAFSQTPTPEQLAQFKSLPKAQQEQLARQYGVDLNSLNAGNNTEQEANNNGQSAIPQRTIAANSIENLSPFVVDDADEIKNFGYDALAGNATDYTPIDDLPIPNDYPIGPGDQLNIELYGKQDQSYSVDVSRDGQITLPEIGPIDVAGLNFSELQANIQRIIKKRSIGVSAKVTLGNMRMMQVYIMGEAEKPGAYNVNAITTVTQALIASGGVKEIGSLRHIQLKRKGQVVQNIDMYNLLLKGDTSSDIRLERGDTLFIPAKTTIATITGAVNRPAHFELRNNTNLATLISNAGGTKANAYLKKVIIKRTTEQGVVVKDVDLSSVSGKQFVIQNGDEIQVTESNKQIVDGIAVRGDIVRQGVYQYQSGMKISSIFNSIDSDLKPSTDLHYALIVREDKKTKEIKVLQFDLFNAITKSNSRDDLTLEKKDQIFVFSNGLDVEYWSEAQNKTSEDLKKEKEKEQQQLSQQYQNQLFQQNQQNLAQAQPGAENTNEDVQYDKNLGVVVEDADKIKDKVSSALDLVEDNSTNTRTKEIENIILRLQQQATYQNPVQVVNISGAVKYPGAYPLPVNGDLNQLIKAAGGLTEAAYLEYADLTRVKNNNNLDIVNQHVDLKHAIDDEPDTQILLQSKDRITILEKPGWKNEVLVTIHGEVTFPGQYSFKRGDTIEDLIARAGGLTTFANSDGAVFAREKLKAREQMHMDMLRAQLKQQIAGLTLRKNSSNASFSSTPMDAMSLVDELDNTKALGRMVINLPKILDGDKVEDVILENQDQLYIPSNNPVVSIMGEVQFSSTYRFDGNKSIEEYIDLAGGMKKQADDDRIYILHADGSISKPSNAFWFPDRTRLRPGDSIVVPIDVDYLDGLSVITSATQVIYQLGVAYDAIKD